MLQDWYSFLDLAILAGEELIGQNRYEATIYRQFHNASVANLSSLYAGDFPSGGGLSGLGFRRYRVGGDAKRHAPDPHTGVLPSEEDVRGWTGREDGGAHEGGRRLLAVPESLVEGMQLRLLQRLLLYADLILPQATPVTLSKMALALRLLTDNPAESTTGAQRRSLQVVQATAHRAQGTLPPGMAQRDYDNLVRAISNVHDMMMYAPATWDVADNTLQMRISLIDHALTFVGATAVATGDTAKLFDNAPVHFSTRNFFSAAWRILSGTAQPVLRAFWAGVSTEIRLNDTGLVRPNTTRTFFQRTAQNEEAADEGEQEEVDGQRRLLQAGAPEAAAGSEVQTPAAKELDLDRQGNSRVIVHLYAQPPRARGAFPYWTPQTDENLLSSVYMVRITEGRWSSLAAKTIPTLEVAFDATTAEEEALVPVNNESSLYYRCHQYMPVFNATDKSAPDGMPPRTWEDRQCVTTYPVAEGEALTCTCTLPDMRDQHDDVFGFEEPVPWTMVAIRKSAPRCYSDEEFLDAQADKRRPVECSSNGKCLVLGYLTGRCLCDAGFWGSFCEHQCVGCSGHGTCEPSSGRCQCYEDYFGTDCSVHPNITSISPNFSPVRRALQGRSVVTVSGMGFGSSNTEVRVKIGYTFATQVRWR